MKFILILSSVLVFAYALPAYDDVPIDRNDPRNYKNIEILILESAVDQDGGYSFSFENDDGSKVSQEGQREIVDDEHSVDRIRGSYSYNDVNGQPVSLTYTADENGYRPVGAHLPTPPPVPLEILRSLRFLATAKPFVDEQLYDYKPKKKVFRGRQYSKANIPIRSRNSLRSTKFSEPLTDSPTSGVFLKSTDNLHDSATEATTTTSTTTASTTTASTTKASATTLAPSAQPTSETTSGAAPAISDKTKPAVQTTLDVLNDSKKNINEAIRESIKKTSQLAQSATQETANAAIAGIREEAAKLTDKVKLQVTKINEKVAVTSAEIDVSKPVKESRDLIELYTKFVPDVVDEALIDVASPKDAQVGRNARLFP